MKTLNYRPVGGEYENSGLNSVNEMIAFEFFIVYGTIDPTAPNLELPHAMFVYC